MKKIDTIMFGFTILGLALTVGWFHAVLSAEDTSPSAEDLAYQKVCDRLHEQFELPAAEAAQRKDLDKAIRLYEAAAAQWQAENFQAEDVQEARYTRIVSNFLAAGELYEQQKEFARAADDYLKCEKIARVSIRRRNGSYLPQAGRAYRQGRDFAKAEEIFKSLIDKAGTYQFDVAPQTLLAQVYEDEGRFEEAEKTLRDYLNTNLASKNTLSIRAARISLKELYTKENHTSDAKKVEAELNDKHCPICGLDIAVVPIAYGLPGGPPNNTVQQGGCIVTPFSPQWWCKNDKISF